MPFEPAHALAIRIRKRDMTCVEAVTDHLSRIDDVNGSLNAVVARNDDHSLAEARAADARLDAGESVGPLHGVPITIKDSIDTAHFVTTAGTEGFRNRVPGQDATVVARLRDAGAIVLGKTNTPELTIGVGTRNEIYGRTNHPHDLSRSPSGSSGGAAAIVASGGSVFDIGSDIGGSIREPAHLCGIAGLKPTHGRIPLTGHWPPFSYGALGNLMVVGPMARSVADLELVLEVIAGPDERDPNCPPVELRPSSSIDPAGLRVLWFVDNETTTATRPVAGAVRECASVLESAGVSITERFPAELGDAMAIYRRLFNASSASTIRRLLDRTGTTNPGPDLADRMGGPILTSAAELNEILEDADRIRGRLLRLATTDFDAILCPVVPFTALLHEEMEHLDHRVWSYEEPINLLGWPAVAVPAGRSPDGLPIGVQVIAPPWREDIALRLAAIIESALGGFVQPPPLLG